MFRSLFKRVSLRRRRPRRLRVESLESRQMMAANPLGATPTDTGEFMLGRVVVTPVLFNSTGELDPSTEHWTASAIDEFLGKVHEATDWWTQTLAGVTDKEHLEFVIDPTFANNPVATKYEPIDRPSEGFLLYGRDFFTSQGIASNTPFQRAVYQFNNAQREKFNADWAYTIFVADATDKADGTFAAGGAFSGAFAYAGGQFIVMPSTRPASTIAHETGHIFWAQDEYAGGATWTAHRGYYDTRNTNAADNSTAGFVQQDSIMRGGVPLQDAYADHTSPASTLAMLGWQDSDGDGVFDLADVPLDFEAIGAYDPLAKIYHLTGSAAAVPMINRNTTGNQSDITLNRISRIEYSIDEGAWQTAATPDAQQVSSIDLSIPVDDFTSIRWRAIDATTGITSAVLTGTPTTPLLAAASVLGFAYSDSDDNQLRESREPTYAGLTLKLTKADGSPLLGGSVDAGVIGSGTVANIDGVTVVARDNVSTLPVFVGTSSVLGDQTVFRAFDNEQGHATEAWTPGLSLEATFDEPIGEASVTVWGLDDSSYGRIEAYDSAGDLIARSTTTAIVQGQSALLRVSDPTGRIASVKVFGQAGTQIAISNLQFGSVTTIVTDAGGTYRIPDLPRGNYRIEAETANVTQAVAESTFSVDVSGVMTTPAALAVHRVDSPFYNTVLAEDVNGDNVVTAADALGVINDLNLHQSRTIAHGEALTAMVDVNNDGRVSAADALIVINRLNQQDVDGPANGEQIDGEQIDGVPVSGMPMSGKQASVDQSIGSPLQPAAAITSAELAAHRDLAFSDWGDPADFGFKTESDTLETSDTTSNWDSRGAVSQNDDPTEMIADSPTNESNHNPDLAAFSLRNVF